MCLPTLRRQGQDRKFLGLRDLKGCPCSPWSSEVPLQGPSPAGVQVFRYVSLKRTVYIQMMAGDDKMVGLERRSRLKSVSFAGIVREM